MRINVSTRNQEGDDMMEFDRNEGESVSLVVDGYVIQIKLLKSGQNKARIGIDAPVGAVMFRNERLAKPIEPADVAATSETTASQAK